MSAVRRSQWTLIGILLLAFALRLFQLEVQSLWWDEGISLHLATSSWAEIIADRVVNIHPPLYFFGLKVWVSLVGLTPFAARYSSVMASLLQITAVYAFSRRWFGRSTAVWFAVGFIAMSPLSVIYSQEIRVYAFLPLVYLALLTITRLLTRGKGQSTRPLWLGLILIEAIGLHLHYIVLFLAFSISLWALFVFFRQKAWRKFWQWVAAQLAVGLMSLPWFIAIILNRMTVQNRVQTGAFMNEGISWRFLLSQIWTFHLTGLPGALTHVEVQWLAVWAALGVLLMLFARWRQWRAYAPLLVQWLVPLGLSVSIWSLRSFSHPRYIAIYAVGLIPLTAYLLASVPRRWQRVLFGLPLVALSLWGLWAYFFDPDVAKDDMRGVAHFLNANAQADDLIFIPDTDWSLPFEYDGAAMVMMPGLDKSSVVWADWEQWTAVRRRVFVVDYPRGTRDWQHVVPFAMEKDGRLTAETRFDGLVVREYELERPLSSPIFNPAIANFNPLRLDAAWVEETAPADNVITVALRWYLAEPVADRYGAVLRLQDVDGWELVASGTGLLDENGRPTDQWLPDQSVTTYHILPIRPGTPPLAYTLSLETYISTDSGLQSIILLDEQNAPQGQQMALSTVQLLPATVATGSLYEMDGLPIWPEPVAMAPDLHLLTAVPDRSSVGTGQSLFVELVWQAMSALPDLRPQLSLVQNGVELVVVDDAPGSGRYPTTLWQTGEVVYEHRRLTVPPTAQSGDAELRLSLGDQQVALAQIEIMAAAHLFEAPSFMYPMDVEFGTGARLIGYDLPQQDFTTGEMVPLTLYWRSLALGTTNYTVFAHLLAEDGHLIGQHDAEPGNGRHPTGGWVADEYIIDEHIMTFSEFAYTGAARIEVGLYDPITGERVMTDSGVDFVYLPSALAIRP